MYGEKTPKSLLQCWCWYQTIHEKNVLDERYSSHMGKGNKNLSFSFSFVQNDVKCPTIHWSVPPSKHFLYMLSVLFAHWCHGTGSPPKESFWTNALYAIALVSLTMQDTPGKFDDIASVNCVCMGKRHRKACDIHWFSFRMTCYNFLCKGLIHQALSLFAIEVPLDVSIGSIRYCNADVDIRPYMKGKYLMRGIAAKWEKATTSCDFHYFLFRMACNARPIIGLFQ